MSPSPAGSNSGQPFHGIFSFSGENDHLLEETNETVATAPVVTTPVVPEATVTEAPKPAKTLTGQIAVDIYEQDNYYIIRAPIAGVRLSDLDIEVDDRVITIRGARRLDESIPDSQYYLQECFWGDFSRSVTMPCSIDPKRVKATFSKDCILKILIPKEEKIKIVRISEGA